MTIDEAIRKSISIAEGYKKVAETGIIFDDVTIDMLFCDDTSEQLDKLNSCAEEHRQLAEWLTELKQTRQALKEIRAEIDKSKYSYMSDKDYDEGVRFGLMLAHQIVSKYIRERSE